MSAPAGPLALLYGTRPQVIKASVLTSDLRARWPLLTVDTGQHYDYELNALLYKQLEVRKADVLLEVGSGTHADQTAAVMSRAGKVLAERRPWAAIVIGDTNSTLGCAIAAAHLRIPVVHVEAGLRSRDKGLAEDINRCAVDAISAVLCAPSAAAAELLRVTCPGAAVTLTGDVAHDVLQRNARRAPPPGAIAGRPHPAGQPFVFTTLHRAELTGDPERLREVLAALGSLALPVVFAAHPRTRAVIGGLGITLPDSVRLIPPLGYLESLAAIRDAGVVVTDSGGVQREAYWLGTPCITVRTETEWTETVAAGANEILEPARAGAHLAGRVKARFASRGTWDRGAYGDGTASVKVGEAVATLAGRL